MVEFFIGYRMASGTIIYKGDGVVKLEFQEAAMLVKQEKYKSLIAYPGDIPGKGFPIFPEVSREKFLEDPALWGVAIYKNSYGRVVCE